MKKAFLCFIFLSFLIISVSAVTNSRVIDNAGILSEEEIISLTEKISIISETYNYDIVILTTPDIDDKTPAQYADDYYDYNGYGYGEDHDGMLFLLSMKERDYYTSTTGFGKIAFTDYGIEYIHNEIVHYLSDGDYFSAFSAYLDFVSDFLLQATTPSDPNGIIPEENGTLNNGSSGTPYDYNNTITTSPTANFYIWFEVIAISLSLLIAFITVSVMKSKMNTAHAQTMASNYVKSNSLNITNQKDVFMYSTVSKVKIATESSSHGGGNSSHGGSSTHVGSSGTSHGGGGGKF